MHMGMQVFLVATSFATYVLFENASLLVDDAQPLAAKDVGLNPTHSQLAKDHDVHHFHEIAALIAKMAVWDVGKAMHNLWNGPDKAADPIAVAKSYIQHPLDHKYPKIDERLRDWAASHPSNMTGPSPGRCISAAQPFRLKSLSIDSENVPDSLYMPSTPKAE